LDGLRRAAQSFDPVQKFAARFLRFAALGAAGALAFSTLDAVAQRPAAAPAEVPPPAQPLAVKAKRGEPLEIQLRIYGRKNEPLKYLIRAEPRYGKVTEPRVVERAVSAVTYTPPADLAVTRDRFSYAVQTGAGVSAAVDVVVTIIDSPPELALSGALDFSPILVGATAAKSLEISNRGGGIAEGKVDVEAPWKIEGSQKYRLGAGERAAFKVVFAPESGGQFESAVRFSSEPEKGVRVRGEALAAIAATPAKVVLKNTAGDPVRTGVFELSNQTDEERRVTLDGGGRLQVPAEVTVPAHGRVNVPVQTAAGDVAVLAGEVRVEASGLTVRVPVQAARVGPIVRAAGGPVVFGRVDAASGAKASFELENAGGAEAGVSWEIGAPFVTEQTSVVLPAGGKKAFAIRTQPAAAGKYRAWVTVTAGAQKLEIPVEAELVGKTASASPPRASFAANPAPVDVEASPAAETAPERVAEPVVSALPPEFLVDLRPPKDVKITQLTATGATIEWPVVAGTAAKFRVERRRVGLDASGELKVRWDELPGTTIRREGEKNVAVLTGLRPAVAYGVRVVSLSGSDTGEPVFTQYFATPAKQSIWPKVTPLRVLFAVLVLCAGLVLRQRRAERQRG